MCVVIVVPELSENINMMPFTLKYFGVHFLKILFCVSLVHFQNQDSNIDPVLKSFEASKNSCFKS